MRARSCAHQHTSPRSRFYTVTRSASAFRSYRFVASGRAHRAFFAKTLRKTPRKFYRSREIESGNHLACAESAFLRSQPRRKNVSSPPWSWCVCTAAVESRRSVVTRTELCCSEPLVRTRHWIADTRRRALRSISRPARSPSMPAGRIYGARRTNFISSISRSLVTSTSSRAWTPSRRRINGRSRA